jgi:thiol-disulfide isomerase/thioredoxin
MKKLWLLIAGMAIVSCKNETPIDYAVITGNIANADDKEMTLYGTTDTSFKKHTITIDEDGSFIDTVKVAGQFTLYQARNKTPLHLEAGNNITINFDAKDYQNTVSVLGNGSELSAYLVAKSNKEKELMGEGNDVYKNDEVDYKKIIYNIKTAQENLLTEAKSLSDEYKAKEKRNINYSYLEKLNRFKSYHSYYAKKPDYKSSKEFLADLNNIIYDNEEDFIYSSTYKSLVNAHYKNKAKEIEVEGDLYNTLAFLKVCETIKSQTIRNTLAYDAVKYNITYTNNVEGLYIGYKAVGSTNEKNNTDIEDKYNVLKHLVKGAPSPKFVNYENYAGGTTSLDDLKGKYTYIDIWATWCGPCIAEIPYLKKIEKQYHGKKIQFLSISVDVKKDYQKWKDMIKEKKLGGIQLFADKANQSQFYKDYYIKGIPKFILLDPQGNIVVPNAPRPSDTKLIALFNELKI